MSMRSTGIKKGLSLFMTVFLTAVTVCIPISATESGTENSNAFYSETALENWISADLSNVSRLDFQSDNICLDMGSAVTANTYIRESGEYRLVFKYRIAGAVTAADSRIELSVDSQKYSEAFLPVLWTDKERHTVDRSGNETVPMQLAVDREFSAFLKSADDVNKSDVVLTLTAGLHSIGLKATVNSFLVSEAYLVPVRKTATYGEYIEKYGNMPKSNGCVKTEAENYSLKSDSYIRGENVQKSGISPYNSVKKKINALSGASFSTPGQKVLWEFEIEKAGLYRITFNCRQDSGTNVPVFRSIEVDGSVPFDEWDNFVFENTGTGKFANLTLKTGNGDAWIYFDKGVHTVALSATVGHLKSAYDGILELISEMNEYGALLKKLSAGSSDANRTWDMSAYMPSAKSDIEKFADRIDNIYKELSELSSGEAVYADNLKYASEQLRKMAEKENKIPNNTEMLCFGDSSATTYLISVIGSITSQALTIDKIYIHGENEIPKSGGSFFATLWDSVKRFLYSFTADAVAGDYGIENAKNSDRLVVWSGDSLLGISILQQYLDETYNKENGTDIRIARMQNDQHLILSNAVGNNPDVVIQAGTGIPFEYAIRSAAKNLLEYDDFFDYYTSRYSLESLVSMYCDKGVYGAVESRDFSVMYYRKDILQSLGIQVPDTWDDVKKIMPVLLRNSMNISHPLAGNGAYNLGNSSALIYQNGGEIYSADGSEVMLDSEYTVDGLTEMTEMFTVYGAQSSVASFFNSFRYGLTPIGFGGFQVYLQLELAAPELAGLWDIAPMPGTLQRDGTVARYSVCNSTACMIFGNTKKSDAAWDFLKWWLSDETQSEYSERRQRNYGTQYLWNTANKKSFETLPFTAEQKNVIRSQFEWQKETVNHPAAYLVAREIGNDWNRVVLNNKSLIDCINNSVTLSNREIKRKLQEFGYMDEDGRLLKSYTTDALAELKRMKEEQK